MEIRNLELESERWASVAYKKEIARLKAEVELLEDKNFHLQEKVDKWREKAEIRQISKDVIKFASDRLTELEAENKQLRNHVLQSEGKLTLDQALEWCKEALARREKEKKLEAVAEAGRGVAKDSNDPSVNVAQEALLGALADLDAFLDVRDQG